MRISDWSSDVCSSDLMKITVPPALRAVSVAISVSALCCICPGAFAECCATDGPPRTMRQAANMLAAITLNFCMAVSFSEGELILRSEEHTSELQSLMRISYAVFCLQKKTQ